VGGVDGEAVGSAPKWPPKQKNKACQASVRWNLPHYNSQSEYVAQSFQVHKLLINI